MIERDKFLTEAIHGPRSPRPDHWKCDAEYALGEGNNIICPICQSGYFSDWEGFGKLWEWAQKQEWWYNFQLTVIGVYITECYIHPDRFADAVYEFLKNRLTTSGK